MGAALDARDIPSAENLLADVEGDIGEVDGVLRITQIRLAFQLQASADQEEKAMRALERFAEKCPAYQSVKESIDCNWTLAIS